MDYPNLQRYRKVLIGGIVLISLTLVVINFEWILSFRSSFSVASLRGNTTSAGTVRADIVHGSDAFYALPETREHILHDITSANTRLQEALLASNSTEIDVNRTARGVIVFLPLDSVKFDKELKALFLSISVMRTYQPATVKTDLIVCSPRAGFAFPASLGCTERVRTSFQDPEGCILVEHVPLKERPGLPHPLVEYANYIDSMLVLSEFHNPQGYSVLMRTDLDTFLTPGFGQWTLPNNTVIVTGRGGYGSENANRHLDWVMKTPLKMRNEGHMGVGSTWVGHSLVMVAAAKLTVSSMIWLHTQEFSIYEKHHAGTDGWPYWHWPVLLLYGGHIAVNQIPKPQVFVTTSNEGIQMDYGTTSNATMPDSVLHIHCWHTDELFSKFRFSLGQYKELDLGPYLGLNTSQSYATSVAVSSDRLTIPEFDEIANDGSKMKNKLWIRQK